MAGSRVVILAVVASLASAHALMPGRAAADREECRDEVSDAEVRARLAELDAVVEEGTSSSRWWWWGWLGALTGIAIAETTIAIVTTDPAMRVDMTVGAIGAWLGALGTVVFPLESAFARSSIAGARSGTASERLAQLRLAEETVESAADGQAFGVSWLPHTLTIVFASGSGLYLWLAEERLGSGLFQFGGALAVGEAKILTQPTSARDGWARYRTRHPTALCRARATRSPAAAWQLAASPGSVGLRFRW